MDPQLSRPEEPCGSLGSVVPQQQRSVLVPVSRKRQPVFKSLYLAMTVTQTVSAAVQPQEHLLFPAFGRGAAFYSCETNPGDASASPLFSRGSALGLAAISPHVSCSLHQLRLSVTWCRNRGKVGVVTAAVGREMAPL